MSQQGESNRRYEDDWWHQLYGSPEGEADSAPARPGSMDDYFKAVRTVIDGPPAGDTPGGGPDGPRRDGPDGRVPDPRVVPPAATAPDAGTTAPKAERNEADPARKAAPLPAPPGSETLHLRTVSRTATEPPAKTAAGPGPGRAVDTGTAAEQDDLVDEGPSYIGDRPPTYAPEPTAWPLADPEDLDSLTPDTVLDGGQHGTLTVRAVSIRGDSARYRGQPRRDALLTARFGTGDNALLLFAVACGARAAENSHRAAREACRWIASAVGRHSDRLAEDIRNARRGTLKSGLHRLTGRCLGRLRQRAYERGDEPHEYSADLRCLLLPADPECRTRVFFGIGEGGLFRLREGEWQDLDPYRDPLPESSATAGPAPRGDGDDTEPSPRFRFRASVGRPGDVLLMCSAGLAEPLRGEPELADLLAGRWSAPSAPPGLTAFLRDVQVRAKGYADDRTAVAAWEA